MNHVLWRLGIPVYRVHPCYNYLGYGEPSRMPPPYPVLNAHFTSQNKEYVEEVLIPQHVPG